MSAYDEVAEELAKELHLSIATDAKRPSYRLTQDLPVESSDRIEWDRERQQFEIVLVGKGGWYKRDALTGRTHDILIAELEERMEEANRE